MRAASSIAKDNFKLVESTLKDATEEMALAVRQAQDRRDRLPLVQSTTEVTALDNYLRPATQAMQRAEQHLLAIEAESRWGKPIAKFQAKRVVAAAAQFLAEQQGIAASVSETALRARQVAMHNDHVAEVARQRQQLGQTIDHGTQWLTSSRNLQAQLSLLKQTLWRHGWVSANTAAVLEQMHHQLVQHDVFTAFEEGKKLIFQVMPAPQTLAEWGGEAQSFLKQARSEGAVGFTALASFGAIVSDATALVLAGCTSSVRKAVLQDQEPVDRWYHLADQLTRPEQVVHWLQWAVYWACFQTAQRFAKDMSLAEAHEEHSTGAFLHSFRSEVERWAGPKIDAMGFPQVTSFMGTLALGGTAAEARLGADFGIIVEINVGGLVVRKVALVQGKVSKNGIADIGSPPSGPLKLTQLQKLNDPQRDFYVFYHRGLRQASVPWPTLNRVSTLVSPATDFKAGSIKVPTRERGWDWPAFIAFGLCSDTSGVGRLLKDDEDALDVLSGGHRQLLPSRLIVVAAGGGDYSLDLQQRVHQHYADLGTNYQRAMEKDDGPEMRGPS
ncbi:hypothetical protein [Pseudomonas sp. H1h]|jgi:hypothetical protein|uniref:hypothetical protein n=1 Tax=Pseudomonas sp. H1h TaxID=1397280 RepID=UPI000469BE54|nr:hypothetical protein [Pseudomonas sp. H1h]